MKKFLSVLVAFCLMLTVMAVAFPVFAEDTYTITFVKADDTSTTQQCAAGDAIVYPALTTSIYGDNVWSASQTAYAAAPKTATGDITVYEYLREGVYEFDNFHRDPITTSFRTGWSLRLNVADDNGKSVLKFTNTEETAYSKVDGTIQSGSYTAATSYDRYNSIDLGKVPAGESKTYRITVAVKREASTLPLYLLPWTNSVSMNYNNSQTKYTEVKIPAVSTNETKYTEYTWEFTTPDTLVENADNKGAKGNYLFLHVGSRKKGESVAYIDYVIVEELTYGNLTYHYANGTTEVVEDLVVGDAIDYADLAPDRLGEHGWYLDAQGTTEAPAELPEGGLHVYEVVKTGVFDFNNYYRYIGASQSTYGAQSPEAQLLMSVVDGDLVYDTSKVAINTTSDNRSVIAIGKAEVATKYKITVEYSYNHDSNNLTLQPVTGYSALTSHATNGTNAIKAAANKVTLEKGNNKTVVIYAKTADAFDKNVKVEGVTNQIPEGQIADCFYLKILTTTNGNSSAEEADQLTAQIHKITVTESKGSVTYNVGEGASVSGESVDSSYVVDYYDNETPVFPTVTYSDGRTVTHWTDDNNSGATVDVPELNGSYTVVTKEPVEMVTVTLNRGGVEQEEQVEKGTEYTLPDTEFTDTSWWSNSAANTSARFVGYEGEKVVVSKDVTYYTAETYAAGSGANMYKNWTVVADEEEGFTYLHKTVTSDASSDWTYSSDKRVCTRLGIVEDDNTYRISVTYKATTDTPIHFLMTISSVTNPGGSMRSYLEESKKFYTVKAGDNTVEECPETDGWKTVTYYLTADTPHEVTANNNNNGLDDTKVNLGFDALYLLVYKETGSHNVDIAIKETKIEDLGNVVEAKGASVLKAEKAEEVGSQALRYYFDYKTATDGTTITIDGKDYPVKERGFLYTNGAITHYAKEGVYSEVTGTNGNVTVYDYRGRYFVTANATEKYGYSASFQMWLAKAKFSSSKNLLTHAGIKEGFENNWAFNEETKTVRFSTYVKGIPEESYDAKMMVRGYVIFEVEEEDGTRVQHTIYSQTVNRSVNGIKNALEAGNAGNNTEHDKHVD